MARQRCESLDTLVAQLDTVYFALSWTRRDTAL